MIAAFFCIAVYIGFVDLGSQWIESPAQPARPVQALSAPEPKRAAVAFESRGAEVAATASGDADALRATGH